MGNSINKPESSDTNIPLFSLLNNHILSRISSLFFKPRQPRSLPCGQHLGLPVVLDPSIAHCLHAGPVVRNLTVTYHCSGIRIDVPVGLAEGGTLRIHWDPNQNQQENRNESLILPIPSAPLLQEPVDTHKPFSFSLEIHNKSLALNKLGEENNSEVSSNESLILPIPSAPLLQERDKTRLASKEPGEESNYHASVGSPLRFFEEDRVIDNTTSLSDAPLEGEYLNAEIEAHMKQEIEIDDICRVFLDNINRIEDQTFNSVEENGEMQRSSNIATDSGAERPMPISHLKNQGEEANNSLGQKVKSSFTFLERSSSNDLSLLNGREQVLQSNQNTIMKKFKTEDPFTPDKDNLLENSLSKIYDRNQRELMKKRTERAHQQYPVYCSPSRKKNSLDDAHDSSVNQEDYSSRNEREMEKGSEGVPFRSQIERSFSRNNIYSGYASQASNNIANSLFSQHSYHMLPQSGEEISHWGNSYSSEHSCQVSNELADTGFSRHSDKLFAKSNQEKNTWNIVVDANCLLDDESRMFLELLEGAEGTYLIIPRIVIRGLDCLERREGIFNRAREASSALKWIEMCMTRTKGWIHVQNYLEVMPVAPTILHSHVQQSNNGITYVLNGLPCSKLYHPLLEILSPTSEDHILDCALFFKKLKDNARFILLTNSLTLKIKCMAEGLLCEAPIEFCKNMVNPYSKSYLWENNSSRGSTCSS